MEIHDSIGSRSIKDDFQIQKHSITKCDKNYSRSQQSLNLAMTASQIQQYATEEVFIPYLHLAVPKYSSVIPFVRGRKFSTNNCNAESCQTIKDMIEKADLLSKFSSLEYNSFPTVCDFIKHVEMNPGKSVAEAFRTFTPDSSKEVAEYGGSTCTGQSRAFVDSLKEISLKGFVIVERMDSIAPPNHAAVVVPCNDGILFIEVLTPPLISILQPNKESAPFEFEIEFPPGKDGIVKKEKISTCFKVIETNEDYGMHHSIIIKTVTISKENGGKDVHHSQFLLRQSANPDVPVMTRYMVAMKIYPLIAKGKHGDELKIKINYDDEIVAFTKTGKDKIFKNVKIPFKIFNSETLEIDLSKELDSEKRKKLSEQISNFVGEGNTIETFWKEFQEPIKIKQQVFKLTRKESSNIIRDLYTQVKRGKD